MNGDTLERIFAAMMERERENGQAIAASFRPSSVELRNIACRGNSLLAHASVEELLEFTE